MRSFQPLCFMRATEWTNLSDNELFWTSVLQSLLQLDTMCVLDFAYYGYILHSLCYQRNVNEILTYIDWILIKNNFAKTTSLRL